MLRLLWSHCRNITVDVFPNKIVYEIPVYSETIFKFFTYSLEKTSSGLRLTVAPIPAEHHLVKPSYDNQLAEKVRLDETDKCLVSHLPAFHKMK
jgi:hypothetical protein